MTENIVMQTYCVFCKAEQYAALVYAISHGEEPCPWCGQFSHPMNEEEYQKLLKPIK